MTKKEFMNLIEKNVVNYLPEEYANAEVTGTEFYRGNEKKTAISVRKKNKDNIAPCIYIDSFFELFARGDAEMEAILKQIAGIVLNAEADTERLGKDISNKSFSDYSKVRDNLFIRLYNVEKNPEILKVYPCRMVTDDLAAALFVDVTLLSFSEHGAISVTESMLEVWDIDLEQAFQDAKKNMVRETEILPIEKVMLNIIKQAIRSEDIPMEALSDLGIELSGPLTESELQLQELAEKILEISCPKQSDEVSVLMRIGSIRSHYLGAGILAVPEILEQAIAMDEDYYILPSSTHELIFVKANREDVDPSSLLKMVKEVNRSKVSPEEKLSDNIYRYDKSSGKLITFR